MKGNCTRIERFSGNNTWTRIDDRVSITGPGLSRETVEEELTLDCGEGGASTTKKKAPGTREFGDISVETLWNPADNVGTRQTLLAIAAGTVSGAGNATLTLTNVGLPGSPLAVSVAVANGDTPAVWAAKARAALAANNVINNLWAVGGTDTVIRLTRRLQDGGIAHANDATANLAIATGTATGITAAASSTISPAGVAGYVNEQNHHLFKADFDNETATFWRIVHPNSQKSGVIVHATVKELGEPNFTPNETVKRTFVLEPTGEFLLEASGIETAAFPPDVPAPVNFWGKD